MAEPRGPRASPGFWLHHAALAWNQEVAIGLRPLGLTPTQFNLLAAANHLGRTGDPVSQQQIAEMSGADRMMASKVIAALEERGLVTRESDGTDQRIRRVVVTGAGQELVRRSVRVVAEADETVFGPPSAERDLLMVQLRQVAESRGQVRSAQQVKPGVTEPVS